MPRSLSVLLPVRDADGLESQVIELLDVLPDIAPRFDVALLADISREELTEAADNLALRFPQVRVVRHSTRRAEAALQHALAEGQGEIVLIWGGAGVVDLQELPRLRRLMDKFDAVIARAPWDEADGQRNPSDDVLLIRRSLAARLRLDLAQRQEMTADLIRHAAAWCEVELARRTIQLATARRPPTSDRVAAAQPRRPRYLQKLKEFALGE